MRSIYSYNKRFISLLTLPIVYTFYKIQSFYLSTMEFMKKVLKIERPNYTYVFNRKININIL